MLWLILPGLPITFLVLLIMRLLGSKIQQGHEITQFCVFLVSATIGIIVHIITGLWIHQYWGTPIILIPISVYFVLSGLGFFVITGH